MVRTVATLLCTLASAGILTVKEQEQIIMENPWLEEPEFKVKRSNSSQSQVPPQSMFQTAGILLSLKHSSLPTRSLPEGLLSVHGFPYIPNPLNQSQQEANPKSPFDILSYTGGVLNSVLQFNTPERAATAIGFTGLGYIPQFGDLANGYYLPSPIPSSAIHKTNHFQMPLGEHFSVSVSGSSNSVMHNLPIRNSDDNFFPSDGNMSEASSSTTDLPIDVEGEDHVTSDINGSDVINHIISESESDKINNCHVCGKVYARPSTLKTHLRTHTGVKPFKCSICFKSFAQDANLTAHLRIHSGEKPFQCTICDRRFAQSSSVTTHMRIHSGERPYKCKVCSRGFADSSTLTKHLRIHTGEKPYQCKICDMRFSQSGNLSRHMRVHKKTSIP